MQPLKNMNYTKATQS